MTAMGMTAQIGTPSDQGELLANASSPGSTQSKQKYETQLMLFQTIPIKTVQVDVVKETKVIPAEHLLALRCLPMAW